MRSSEVVTMVEYEFHGTLWKNTAQLQEVAQADPGKAARDAPARARAFRFFRVTKTERVNWRGKLVWKYRRPHDYGKWFYIDGQIYSADLAEQSLDVDQSWLGYMRMTGSRLLVTNDKLMFPFDPEREEVVSSL